MDGTDQGWGEDGARRAGQPTGNGRSRKQWRAEAGFALTNIFSTLLPESLLAQSQQHDPAAAGYDRFQNFREEYAAQKRSSYWKSCEYSHSMVISSAL